MPISEMRPDATSRTPVRLQGNLFFLSSGQCIPSYSKQSCVFLCIDYLQHASLLWDILIEGKNYQRKAW